MEIEKLPANEREAEYLLREGALDSAFWRIIQPYYNQPLSVPTGELRYINDIFPDFLRNLPIKASSLSSYEPWNRKNIDRFFNDYPELKPLNPILSFASSDAPHWAVVGIHLSRHSHSNNPSISTNFSLFPVEFLSARAKVRIDNDYALWQRRYITSSIGKLGDISLGNYSSSTAGINLFYGYFPSVSSDSLHLKENWLYGESRTWNGGKAAFQFSENTEATAFVHTRLSESAAGMLMDVSPRKNIKACLGFSGLEIKSSRSEAKDTIFYVQTGSQIDIKCWSIEIQTGMNTRNPFELPLWARACRKKGATSGSVSFIRIPGKFTAPRSLLKNRLINRLDLEKSHSETVYECRMDFMHKVNDYINYSPSFLYAGSGTRYSFDGIFIFKGTKPLDYKLRYQYHPSIMGGDEYHRISFSCLQPVGRGLQLKLRGRSSIKPGSYANRSACFSMYWDALPSLMLEPYCTYYGNTDGDNDFYTGLIQEIDLFEKTNGELEFELPLTKVREICIHAKANYFF
ncbi:MAG: hypothetical protein GF401_16985 [Chitinivibrionales bacterium]|nr:hypothetical protein [Chitinivibrionales bacterium]